ncbi:MAG TPA: branched-chain amino acid ABC transporter ATP-binding protein/permease [Burkholderiales bacterium]|nr:branched-chain amino acid ABC transporter ATP-binding protein/permease [Burkholderiales bacterium]
MSAVTLPNQPAAVARQGWIQARFGSDFRELLIGAVLIAGTGLIPDIANSSYWTHAFELVNIFIIASICQNLLLVDAGQTSFGMGAIFGLAGYGAAIANTMHGVSYGWSVVLGLLASLAGGVLFALPALRVQHFYLGFVTLSAAVVLPELAMAFNTYTNGIIGISLQFDEMHKRTIFGMISPLSLLVVVVTIAVLVVHALLHRSLLGRRMRIAAESPEAAQALGISPGMMRFIAFLIAGVGTGIAGVIYPVIVGFVGPTSFSLDISILFFFAVIVGGRGTLLGPIVGVWVLYLLPNILLAEFVNWRLIAYGVAALLIMILMPDGIVGGFNKWRQKVRTAGKRLDLNVAAVLGAQQGAPSERAPKSDEVLVQVKQGRKTFGKVVAVDSADLVVKVGEIHGLVGANGSGKTSLLNVLSGFSRLDAGSLHVDGVDITRLSPHRIARLGIGRTFQTPRIFGNMSLWENIQIGRDARFAGSKTPIPEASVELLRQTLGEGSPDWVPHGQRRLLEVLRVALQESKLLLLDEPAAGLSPEERKQFGALLRQLRDQYGKTFVLVEHDLDLVWGVADRITVMDAGRIVATGTPEEVAKDPAVRHMFIESSHA